jgi:hypothetical protein
MLSTFIVSFFLFVALNVLASVNGVLWALHCASSRESLIGFAANWATIFVGQIVLVQTVLGVLGWLNSWNTLIVLILLLATSLLLFKREDRVPRLSMKLRLSFLHSKGIAKARAVLVLVVWVTVGISIAALTEPSTLWDGFGYHLPMAVNWMQSQYLQPTYLPFATEANSYFPGNGELLFLWMLAPLRNDLLVRLVNVFVWFVLALALFRICRQVGASDQASGAATLLFIFTPIVFSQAAQLFLDITGAAMFLLALGHLLEFKRVSRLESVILLSIASGLFVGIKLSGPAYLLLLLGGLLLVLWRERRRSSSLFAVGYCVIFVLGTITFGGYWHIRNLILTGNPVYPVRLSFQELVILPGAYSGTVYHSRQLLQNLGTIPLSDILSAVFRGVGFFYLFALLAAVLLLFASVGRLVRQRGGDDQRDRTTKAVLLLGFIGGSLVLYLNTPYSIMRFGDAPITVGALAGGMRFGIISFALCAVLVALAFSRRPRLVEALWLILPIPVVQSLLFSYDLYTYLFFADQMVTITQSVVAGMVVVVLILAWRAFRTLWSSVDFCWHPSWYHYIVSSILAVSVVFVVGCGLYGLMRYREGFRYAVYRDAGYDDKAVGWEWVADNIHGAKIALTGCHLFYPLYGADLQNEVRYINIAGELDDRYHNYEPYASRKGGSYGIWLRNLKEWGAHYLVAGRTTEEEDWAIEHPETFDLVFRNPQIRVYEIAFH